MEHGFTQIKRLVTDRKNYVKLLEKNIFSASLRLCERKKNHDVLPIPVIQPIHE